MNGFFLTTAEFTEFGIFPRRELFTLRPKHLGGEFLVTRPVGVTRN